MSLFDNDNGNNNFCLQMETSSNASIKEQLTIRHSEEDGNEQLAARCTMPKPAECNTTAGITPEHEPPHASVSTTSMHHKQCNKDDEPWPIAKCCNRELDYSYSLRQQLQGMGAELNHLKAKLHLKGPVSGQL
ncbi:hypothetical protein M404DRAFT_28808 [Pisolithus tinctorius Marx 270]|uniref:Uncharacterized protein n=1 Tax=Pisolithus tinctorius Marx 270 TaxID=870435 RepID=A0A0C3IWR3_PISTI|nr:hypothetical protein M404DRAFT_28808 [Pisolithus tinctorius Marx 270]